MSDKADRMCKLEHETFLNLVRSHDCLTGDQQRFFHQFGLTAQQFNVLKVLSDCPDARGFPCQVIAEKLLNRVPDITRLLDRLEQAGWIGRIRCCHDRRVVRTHLTVAGRAKFDEARGPLREVLSARLAHMSEDELQQLNRLLIKLRGTCTGSEADEDTVSAAREAGTQA